MTVETTKETTQEYGSQAETAALRRVIVRRPDESFAVEDPDAWNYASRPHLAAAQAEHDALTATLQNAGAEVVHHESPQPGRADAIFVRDPVLMTRAGVIILTPGKDLRRGEEEALAALFEELGVPILHRLSAGPDGETPTAEGGDFLWLDDETLAVGLGFRTNRAAVDQLSEVLKPHGVNLVTVELPYADGPRACLHLGSYISMLDRDLAVAHLSFMAVSFWRLLNERGIQLVEVPDDEYATMAPNVLCLAPRKGLMLEGNPKTQERLEAAGCEVLTYRGNELSLKAEGGPTCLTLPLLRTP